MRAAGKRLEHAREHGGCRRVKRAQLGGAVLARFLGGYQILVVFITRARRQLEL